MYEYKFIRIELARGFLNRYPTQDYHEIIRQNAREGWKLFQIFSPPTFGYGKAVFYELIFEKEIKEGSDI